MEHQSQTYFVDIDGTILFHYNEGIEAQISKPAQVLPGVLDMMYNWVVSGHTIVLITGRPWSSYDETIKQLTDLQIPFDQLIMGLGRGCRTIINDLKPGPLVNVLHTCHAINVERNSGHFKPWQEKYPEKTTMHIGKLKRPIDFEIE